MAKCGWAVTRKGDEVTEVDGACDMDKSNVLLMAVSPGSVGDSREKQGGGPCNRSVVDGRAGGFVEGDDGGVTKVMPGGIK